MMVVYFIKHDLLLKNKFQIKNKFTNTNTQFMLNTYSYHTPSIFLLFLNKTFNTGPLIS